jgi:hypothetical protein
MGKSATDDAHDGDDDDDDELQRFSKGVRHSAVVSRRGVMDREHRERKYNKVHPHNI